MSSVPFNSVSLAGVFRLMAHALLLAHHPPYNPEPCIVFNNFI